MELSIGVRGTAARFALVLMLVVAADWLLMDVGAGLNYAVFAALLVLALVLTQPRLLLRPQALAAVAAVLGLVAALVWQPGPLVMSMSLGGLMAVAVWRRPAGWPSGGRWMYQGLNFAFAGCLKAFLDIPVLDRWYRSRMSGGRLANNVDGFLKRWWLPVLLSLVFLGLFVIANPLLSTCLQTVLEAINELLLYLPQTLSTGRLFVWMLVGLWCWALLRLRRIRRPPAVGAQLPVLADEDLLPALLERCLWLFNLVFLLQNVLDARYLWAGAQLPEGIAPHTYVHRGSYPLVATALLAALFVLVAFRQGLARAPLRRARVLVIVWLLQNVFLTASAGWRLWLYVQEFMLTRLRVATIIWLVLVAVGLLLIALRIIQERNNRWLVNVNFAILVAVLYTCCFVNFDRHIADYNVRHCQTVRANGKELHLEYLTHLGPDSLPALDWLIERTPDPLLHGRLILARDDLRAQLADRQAHWRTWTATEALLAR